MLKRVISGGQSGVDLAGITAARRAGMLTGGWVPREFLTEAGRRPDLSAFGLVEHPEPGYGPRTDANVRDSDATIRVAKFFGSPGEKRTLAAIYRFNKPTLALPLQALVFTPDETLDQLCQFVVDCHVVCLNVAGNAESTCPGIFAQVEPFLFRCFQALRDFVR